MITLNDIWNSSTGLLQRFDLVPNLDAAWSKVIEEHDEMIEALYDMTRKDRKRNVLFRNHLAKEAGDCLVTLLNAAYAVGMTEDLLSTIQDPPRLWDHIDPNGTTQKARLMALSKATYPYYVQLLDVQSGDNTATLYGVSVYLDHCIKALAAVVKGAGLSYEEFEAAIEAVMFKNNAKTPDNYEIVDGMIVKRNFVITEGAQ